MNLEELFKNYLSKAKQIEDKSKNLKSESQEKYFKVLKFTLPNEFGVDFFSEQLTLDSICESLLILKEKSIYKTKSKRRNNMISAAVNHFERMIEELKTLCVNMTGNDKLFTGEETKIEILNKYLQEVEKNVLDLRNVHSDKSLIAFRGESADYGKTACTPSFFRGVSKNVTDLMLLEAVQDYDVLTKMSKIDLAIHSQHYYQTSKMLDISFNILSALFFACSASLSDDAKIYVYCFPKSYSPSSEYVNRFYDKTVMKEPILNLSTNFKVLRHSTNNERIKHQQGGFILFHGDEFSPISPCYYREVIVKYQDKEKILSALKLFFGFNEISVYPEAEHRRESLLENLENAHHTSFSKDIDFLTIEIEQAFAILRDEIFWEITQLAKEEKSDCWKKEAELKLRADCNFYIKHIKSKISEIENEIGNEIKVLNKLIEDEKNKTYSYIKEKLYLNI